jgi:hypothetical protein
LHPRLFEDNRKAWADALIKRWGWCPLPFGVAAFLFLWIFRRRFSVVVQPPTMSRHEEPARRDI